MIRWLLLLLVAAPALLWPLSDGSVGERPVDQLLWPPPSTLETGPATAHIHPSHFTVEVVHPHPLVEELLVHYLEHYLFPFPYQEEDVSQEEAPPRLLTRLVIDSSNLEAPLGEGDEGYSLEITEQSPSVNYVATIRAPSQRGVLRALDTFSQLVQPVGEPRMRVDRQGAPYSYRVGQVPLSIRDHAARPWRGLTLDTARHFSPLSELKQILDAMSWTKMNVLHWHFTDDAAFAFASASVETLARGAFSPVATYTPKEIRKIVQYARQRGIFVLPELAMPSHVHSWQKAGLDVTMQCPGHGRTQLDLASPHTFPLVEALLRELADLFPDVPIHLGGKSVDIACLGGLSEANRFYEHCQRVLSDLSRTAVVWQDVVSQGVTLSPDHFIVQCDTNADQCKQAIRKGHRVLLSMHSNVNEEWTGLNSQRQYEEHQKMLQGFDGSKSHVLGGEMLFWANRAGAGTRNYFLWPFAADVAANLWSSAHRKYNDEALYTWLCRTQRRGVPTEDIGPGFCGVASDARPQVRVQQAGGLFTLQRATAVPLASSTRAAKPLSSEELQKVESSAPSFLARRMRPQEVARPLVEDYPSSSLLLLLGVDALALLAIACSWKLLKPAVRVLAMVGLLFFSSLVHAFYFTLHVT